MLVSGVRTGKSLGLFCFKKEDAEALLEQMRSMNRDMREGSKVVAVALNKVRRFSTLHVRPCGCSYVVDGISMFFISMEKNFLVIFVNAGHVAISSSA